MGIVQGNWRNYDGVASFDSTLFESLMQAGPWVNTIRQDRHYHHKMSLVQNTCGTPQFELSPIIVFAFLSFCFFLSFCLFAKRIFRKYKC